MNFLETAILIFIGSFLVTYLTIPKIIGVVSYKRLMDAPNERSSHKTQTPSLGGIAFYYTLIISLFFINSWDTNNEIIHIIPGLTILFIIGLKDDLVVLSPGSKLIAQLAAVSFVVANSGFTIHSLNGFFNIEEIPYYIYFLIGVFIMVTIINSYNLIDGIDGLASIVGIVILIIYTTIFYLTKEYFYALITISLNACLLAFFGYNVSSTKKIFMGDTGSLIVGFVISIMTLKFLALKPSSSAELPFFLENIPLIAISILIVPLFDTARVFAIRIANKKSPFSPDRNHTHHVLIDYWGLSHKQASYLIGGFNIIFVVLFIVLGSTTKNLWLFITLLVSIIILSFIFFRFNYNFTSLKQKILFRRKVKAMKENLKPKTKKDKDNK
ncbi:UDP-N-acetylmuramyl pentapeptide phosphotransferase/UDP-N-acetylglucosamine-1-phosphate transferase [Aquimarina sp. EL_43]|uniref:MraY family glycosyltransferase n=1 Tax=unclassified Aquimarina TaxID=2627091 RepID=UPI0018CAFAF3|nr:MULTISPECIES: MraY family glycosyltransferase [unclassified Aquimarina]MBG6131691.1 UDP-N-acetylmuramyl pentapeptide phosphotransferase/UDP-N-acetylglucosamine-1-phosphate transferase [Aquimarina sp. EL_35]MBG6152152.1 UDP-N-acetylmuramyl pentapeptide phosphotransferase/UDP-N-acetylglucosamine-1-phosphate transferase [Aquimarina sp. EL_32]MBG6169904.1 UDP-N-acetylmuramyl pentapeptide phosphotransferase/UDP-N-acetylglucosamine-1-phosphate transferase [Aquimarina sp. EL_43]